MHLTGEDVMTEPPEKRAAVSLKTIKTWPTYYREIVSVQNDDPSSEKPEKIDASSSSTTESLYKVNRKLDNKISLYCGDITMLQVDAIVNSTDATLSRSSGVSRSICKVAGPKLREKLCHFEEIESGHAIITKGYKLPAKHIIHTCGPSGKKERRSLLLSDCYRNTLKLFMENKLRSIAFPCIATGVKGFGKWEAANIALREIREWLDKNNNNGQVKHVERIVLCVLLEEDRLIYERLMPKYFPLNENSSSQQAKGTKRPSIQTQSLPPVPTTPVSKSESLSSPVPTIPLNSEIQGNLKFKDDPPASPTSPTVVEPKLTEKPLTAPGEKMEGSNSDQMLQLMSIVQRMEKKLDCLNLEIASLKLENAQMLLKINEDIGKLVDNNIHTKNKNA